MSDGGLAAYSGKRAFLRALTLMSRVIHIGPVGFVPLAGAAGRLWLWKRFEVWQGRPPCKTVLFLLLLMSLNCWLLSQSLWTGRERLTSCGSWRM